VGRGAWSDLSYLVWGKQCVASCAPGLRLGRSQSWAVCHLHLMSPLGLPKENIDGDLASRVLGLLPVMDEGYHSQRYGERSKQRLDMAVINFFQCFRKVYIGEQVSDWSGGMMCEPYGTALARSHAMVTLRGVDQHMSCGSVECPLHL